MNSGAFGENFPYSNFHDLNMDWIIKIAKDFLDQYTHIQQVIQTGLDDMAESRETGLSELNQKTLDGLADLQTKYDALDGLLQAWYNTHSADIAEQLANALNDLNAWYTEHEGYLDQYVQDSITQFNTSADQKAQQTIASIPSDYTTLSNDVSDLKSALYFNKTYETQEIEYHTGTISSNGGVNPGITDYQYSDAIKLNKGDVIYINNLKKIFRIRRYNGKPIIGTTVPDRLIEVESTYLNEDQEQEYVALVWDKRVAGTNPSIIVCKNIARNASDLHDGLMSSEDKRSLDFLVNAEEQDVVYGTGTVSTTNGAINPQATDFQYSSAIYLKSGDMVRLDDYKTIYRIARYNNEPVIGTTVPNRAVTEVCDYFVEDQEQEYVVLVWDTRIAGTDPKIYVHHSSATDIPLATPTRDGLMSKEDKGKLDGLSDEVATPARNGLMSKSDKAKLDNIVNPGTITIEGSGVTKNASAYGFLPTKTGTENSAALQNAVNGGGTILIDYPGVYDVCDTCILESNTHLVFGSNVFINRVKDAQNKTAVYPFVNAGSYGNDYDENISITGLHLITNGLGIGTNGTVITGQRGQLSFANIKNLTITDFEVLDGTDTLDYNIHVQRFENLTIKNVKIISQKDGIHLGTGKHFIIQHAYFITNDDAIALNTIDYSSGMTAGTRYLGWIEDGIIEDITFAQDNNYRTGRGLFLLSGAWKNWTSGNSYRTYGDFAVSNGRIYTTSGERTSPATEVISTVRPTHESGTQTYSDGVTWYMMQNVDVGYNSGVKNVVFRDIYISRSSSAVLTASMDNDPFLRSYYPGSIPPVLENIMLENIFTTDERVDRLINSTSCIRNLRIENGVYNMISRLGRFYNAFTSNYQNSEVTFNNIFFKLNNNNKNLFLIEGNATLRTRISNSLGNFSEVAPTIGNGVTLLSNDLGIN